MRPPKKIRAMLDKNIVKDIIADNQQFVASIAVQLQVGHSPEEILYFNFFEKDRLSNVMLSDLDTI